MLFYKFFKWLLIFYTTENYAKNVGTRKKLSIKWELPSNFEDEDYVEN